MKNEMVPLHRDQQPSRSPGFYWIRRLGESGMQVGRWSGMNWFLAGREEALTDDDIAAISTEQVRPVCQAL